MEKTLEDILSKITPVSQESREKARDYINTLAMPPWALGKLLDLAVDLAGIQGKRKPEVKKKMIFTMAADHGIAEEGVSAFPQEVTVQMAQNILLGGAGVNVLGKQNKTDVQLVDMGVLEDLSSLDNSENLEIIKIANGSNNFYKGPAMTREQAEDAIIKSYNLVSEYIEKNNLDVIGTGELGIGNTTPAAAILSVLGDLSVEEATGRGTGLDDKGLDHKIKIIKESIALNNPNRNDSIDVLSKVGGYDIAGIVGTILAAATHKIPVVIDGFISTSGALIAASLDPNIVDYMISSHQSAEPGHKKMWEKLGKEPLLDLNMRLGEGTGGAMAMNIIESACAIVNNMMTFSDAGVSTSETANVENFEKAKS